MRKLSWLVLSNILSKEVVNTEFEHVSPQSQTLIIIGFFLPCSEKIVLSIFPFPLQ